jgi:flagellar motor switch protein FliN/FliY
VTEAIQYEQFEAAPVGDSQNGVADLSRLSDIPMELSVEIGRTHMTVGETLELRVGAVVGLERRAGEPVELLVNGSAIARGEVVVVDEQYGLRITQILDGGQQAPDAASDAAAAAAGQAGVSGEGEPAGITDAEG